FLGLLRAAAVLLRRSEGSRSPGARIVLPVALGLAGAAYWLTREEGLWLLPALAVLAAAVAADAWRQWRASGRAIARRDLWRRFVALAIAGIVFGAGMA